MATHSTLSLLDISYHQTTHDKDIDRLTVDDAYSVATLRQFMKISWARSYLSRNGGVRTQKLIGARDRISYSWNHFMITRGQNILDAKLSSLFPHIHATAEDGQQLSLAIVLRIGIGKTNQDHAIYSSCIRSKDVEICPVGALAFYLLERWMVSVF